MGGEVKSLRYKFKSAFCMACALLLLGTAFAMTWSSPKMLTGDSYIAKGFEDENFGTEEILWASSEEDEPQMEAWLSFDTILMIESLKIKSLDDIYSATLRVYAKEVEIPGEVELHFYNSGFFEETVVWDGKPDYDGDVEASIDVDDEGWYEIDATSLIKKAIAECKDCPFSAVLVAKGDASVGFASKEDSEGNVPVLKVTTLTV
jgi:hypothetical protein